MNVVTDIRSARVAASVKALVLTHPGLPKETRARLTQTATALRLVIATDQMDLARQIVGDLEVLLTDLRPEVLPVWHDRVGANLESLLKGLDR